MTKISEIKSENLNEASSQDYLRNFSKRMLKTHLFIGSYHEKRFVEPLNSYRDVITVDSDEQEFIENVIAVKKKLKQGLVRNYLKDPTWIGITDPDTIGAPVGYNLWVVLPIEIFGKYWFKVKTVEFLSNEVRVKLDVVRPLKNDKSTSDVSESEDNQSFDLKTTMQDVLENLRQNLLLLFKENFTFGNIKSSVIFISLLIGTIITGGANIIKYLMEYTLELIRTLSGFIRTCTPIIISCLNLLGKTIYGLYALIVELCYGNRVREQPVYNSYYNVDPNDMLEFRSYKNPNNQYPRRRALPSGGSVRITPLED